MRKFALTLVAGTLLAAGSASADGLRLPAENWTIPYSGSASAIPACDSPNVLSTIQSRFVERESTYWSSNLTIVGFEKLRPVGLRNWGLDIIPRLVSTGDATTSDGKPRRVDYVIAESTGIIGWGWGVEWCLSGLDRQLGFAPDCKMARP